MSFSFMMMIELVLFNVSLFCLVQPSFIFGSRREEPFCHEERIRRIMTVSGIIFVFLLFAWSFYFGARVVLYKNSILVS